jgi:formylglycine-generating enzyme required for sulfatase activity
MKSVRQNLMRKCYLTFLVGTLALFLCSCPVWAGPAAQLVLTPQCKLSITGEVGSQYDIQFSTNLANPRGWTSLSLITLPASPYVVPGTAPAAVGCRFYRAVAIASQNPTVLILPGTFNLGSPTNELDRFSDEGPQTAVTISRGFQIGLHPVTQQEYQSVTGSNPSAFTGDLNRPVDQVSWNDATNYCALLTQRELAAGRIPAGSTYRLPTEAEWEYAARAGTSTRFFYGEDPDYADLANYAWYQDNSDGQTQPVGQKLPNPWGLYDVYGNVWEWCQDWYVDSYPGGTLIDPQGPAAGDYRVLRGGSWSTYMTLCRSATRLADVPTDAFSNYGFRIVLVPGQP